MIRAFLGGVHPLSLFPGGDLGGGDVLGSEVFLMPDTLMRGSSPDVLHVPSVLRLFFNLHHLLDHICTLGTCKEVLCS